MEFHGQFWIYGIGFFGQALFGLRLLVQWFTSEREGKVVSPVLYWQISLVASFIILVYGVLRKDPVIIIGQLLSYYIYIRNLQLKRRWTTIYKPMRYFLFTLPVISLVSVFSANDTLLQDLTANVDFLHPMFVVGTIGQLMLNLRFVYQWYYSERRKVSILPLGFWIISLMASLFVITYGWYRRDPVLLLSQGLGLIAYTRNIYFYSRQQAVAQTP